MPVTVLTGPLGAGKTTLLNRLLDDPGGRRLAVIVNDMGEVNIDAELLESETEDGIVDLSNGCICCRLRGDLREQARRLASERAFDHLVVEASGISEPVPIARALTEETDDDSPYRLDSIVAVVDAFGFWKAFDPDESLPGPDPERPLTDVLVDQIEFCSLLLLNKCDMVPEGALDEIEATIRQLQPEADLFRTTHGDVDPEQILDTDRFDREANPGWKQLLAADQHDHDQSAPEAHGVESFVYRAHRPFDPVEFDDWLTEWDGDIVRAKGFTWVTSRPEQVLGLSQAGPSVQAGPIGEWGEDEPLTKLVFIGSDLDADRIRAELDRCLVATESRPQEPLSAEADPFPREH